MDVCTRQALLLVVLQIALVFFAARTPLAKRRIRGSGAPLFVFLIGAALMFAGILLVFKYPAVGWGVFTLGAMLLSAPYGAMRSAAVGRALAVCALLLLFCFALAPFFGNFYSWTPYLFLAVLALIVLLAWEILYPSRDGRARTALASFGAVVFALWTVRDLRDSLCASPFEKSVRIFLDLLNLFSFSSLGGG